MYQRIIKIILISLTLSNYIYAEIIPMKEITNPKAKSLKAERNNKDKFNIKSNQLIIDHNKKISIFEGNVIVEFGDIILKTTQVKVFYKINDLKLKDNINLNDKLEKIIIAVPFTAVKGSFNEKDIKTIENLLPGKNIEIIKANYAEYTVARKELFIKNNVKIMKDNKTIFCDELIYNTEIVKIHD